MGSLLYLKLSVTKTELLHILQKKSFFPCAQNFCLFFFNIYLYPLLTSYLGCCSSFLIGLLGSGFLFLWFELWNIDR